MPYSVASINQIIKEADISREVYIIFRNKDDLLQYLVSGFPGKVQEAGLRQLGLKQGDLLLFETVHDDGTDHGHLRKLESRGQELAWLP